MKEKITALFREIRREILRVRYGYHALKTGWVYHEHSEETVVSKKEYYIQLSNFSRQDNLIDLLLHGKNHPNYDILLTLVSMKFEYLGSLVFPVSYKKAAKASTKTYVYELFKGFYETPDQVRAHLGYANRDIHGHPIDIKENPVSDETVDRVFRKLLFVVGTCCPCMADSVEFWRWNTYRGFLEYAIEHDNFSFFAPCAARNIMQAIPEGLPAKGNKRSYVLGLVPDELKEKVVCSTWKYSIRW